jgi:hypothetical protein
LHHAVLCSSTYRAVGPSPVVVSSCVVRCVSLICRFDQSQSWQTRGRNYFSQEMGEILGQIFISCKIRILNTMTNDMHRDTSRLVCPCHSKYKPVCLARATPQQFLECRPHSVAALLRATAASSAGTILVISVKHVSIIMEISLIGHYPVNTNLIP